MKVSPRDLRPVTRGLTKTDNKDNDDDDYDEEMEKNKTENTDDDKIDNGTVATIIGPKFNAM